MKNLRFYLCSSDVGILDRALADLIDVLKKNGIEFIGPIPLPTGFSSFRPFDGNVTYRRLIDVKSLTEDFIHVLDNISLPSGVDVKMKYV